jgi:hypothetical protein
MDKADFYIGIDKYAKWIGSLLKKGDPVSIVMSRFLLTKNPVEYEELFTELLEEVYYSVTPEDGWPHPWQDSHMTDYSYHLFNGKVWCSMMGGQLFDPLTIIGGEDLIAAEKYAPRIKVEYPFMLKPYITHTELMETFCGVFK